MRRLLLIIFSLFTFHFSLFAQVRFGYLSYDSVLQQMPEYAEAIRMQQFLSNFLVIPPDRVPPTSVIREFIGKSFFKY